MTGRKTDTITHLVLIVMFSKLDRLWLFASTTLSTLWNSSLGYTGKEMHRLFDWKGCPVQKLVKRSEYNWWNLARMEIWLVCIHKVCFNQTSNGTYPYFVSLQVSSYDTVGNAYFALTIHAIPAQWKRIAIVTSSFHMPRSRLLFEHMWHKAHVTTSLFESA